MLSVLKRVDKCLRGPEMGDPWDGLDRSMIGVNFRLVDHTDEAVGWYANFNEDGDLLMSCVRFEGRVEQDGYLYICCMDEGGSSLVLAALFAAMSNVFRTHKDTLHPLIEGVRVLKTGSRVQFVGLGYTSYEYVCELTELGALKFRWSNPFIGVNGQILF